MKFLGTTSDDDYITNGAVVGGHVGAVGSEGQAMTAKRALRVGCALGGLA